MYLMRAAYFILVAVVLSLAGCGDKSAETGKAAVPAGIMKIKFSDAAFPEYLTVTGVTEAKSWGRRAEGDKVVMQFGSVLPSKFVLTLSAKAVDLNMPVSVKVGEQVQTIKLESTKMKPIKLTFSPTTPTDRIEIEVPQTVIKGKVQRMTIALVGFELEAVK